MAIILKESNLVYTKYRSEKFIGSSCFRFDRAKNAVYKKEKLVPIPFDTEPDPISEAIAKEVKEKIASERKKRSKEYRLNKKKVREKCSAMFGLKQSRKFLAFYSISFPMGFPDENAIRCLNSVLTSVRMFCGLKTYVRVTEFQKNGTIHFHLLTNNYMYIRKVNAYMAKAIKYEITKYNLPIEFNHEKYNGVDVRHVNNNKKALNCYLTKYVSKNDIVHSHIPYHCSRDISQLFTAETFVNDDSSDFSQVKKDLRHIQTYVVENEWATMEYFCQKQANGKYFNPPDSWYWFRDYVNEIIYKNHHAKCSFDYLPLG